MPPRPIIPADDLYARLELPVDASFEAVEIAWRALLKRHHPDVAGAAADDVAKRINVAHDWLSDPALRDRYDRERHPARATAAPSRTRAGPRSPAYAPRGPRSPAYAPRGRRSVRRRRPADPAEALDRHVDRVAALRPDELDRLSLAESPPIAFVATIARFLSPERQAEVEAVERRVLAALPPAARWDAPSRDAAVAYAHQIVLGPFLDEHLSEPFRDRVRERLTRGWEAAVDQPRYGPNSAAVAAALERLAAAPEAVLRSLAGTAPAARAEADLPWPAGLSPDDDDALRVSSALARRDAARLVPAAATASLGRAMHALVLRHAFAPVELERLMGPWRELLDPAGRQAAGRQGPRRA